MGEKPGQREAMDRFIHRLVKNGVPAKEAKKEAIKQAVKNDRKTKNN